MNAKEIIKFFKSSMGKLTLAFIGIAFVMIYIYSTGAKEDNKNRISTEVDRPDYKVTSTDFIESRSRKGKGVKEEEKKEVKPRVSPREAAAQRTAARTSTRKTEEKKEVKRQFSPMRIGSTRGISFDVPVTPTATTENSELVRDWTLSAPYGRLLKCELVTALQSSNLESPLIALVTEDLWWGGKLLIPANTEVHGVASGVTARDRIGGDTRWTIILKEPKNNTRRELVVNGVALDRTEAAKGTEAFARYGLTDGSAGIAGKIIKDTDIEEIKLFASAFISGFASLSLDGGNNGITGEFEPDRTATNGALNGVSTILNEYAEQIRAEIERNGRYVAVNPGKQFYLYIQQTLDLNEAQEGLHAAGNVPPETLYRRLYQDDQSNATTPAPVDPALAAAALQAQNTPPDNTEFQRQLDQLVEARRRVLNPPTENNNEDTGNQ